MRFTLVLVALFLIPSSLGMGISPAQTIIHYGVDSPEFTFRPVGTGTVQVSVEGNLREFIEIDQTTLSTQETLTGRILPLTGIAPGTHVQRIVFTETTAEQGTIGAAAQIAGTLVVEVPVEGSFLRATWEVTPNPATNSARITVMLENIGDASVVPTVQAVLDGQVVSFRPETVPPGAFVATRGQLAVMTPGQYDVLLQVIGDNQIEDMRTVSFGQPRVTITDVRIPNEQGTIRPIDIEGVVEWNVPVQGAIVIDADEVMVEEVLFNGQFSERVYFDTSNGMPDEITVTVRVRQSEDSRTVQLLPTESEMTLLPILILCAILVLLLVFIVKWRKLFKGAFRGKE